MSWQRQRHFHPSSVLLPSHPESTEAAVKNLRTGKVRPTTDEPIPSIPLKPPWPEELREFERLGYKVYFLQIFSRTRDGMAQFPLNPGARGSGSPEPIEFTLKPISVRSKHLWKKCGNLYHGFLAAILISSIHPLIRYQSIP
jgi:hypothetical protein